MILYQTIYSRLWSLQRSISCKEHVALETVLELPWLSYIAFWIEPVMTRVKKDWTRKRPRIILNTGFWSPFSIPCLFSPCYPSSQCFGLSALIIFPSFWKFLTGDWFQAWGFAYGFTLSWSKRSEALFFISYWVLFSAAISWSFTFCVHIRLSACMWLNTASWSC